MAAPTNISFVTATALTTLPQTITQLASDAGTTYDLYFKVPSALITADVTELSIFGFGDLTTYKPTTTAYVGPASGPTQIVRPISGDPAGLNLTIQVPVDSGHDYLIKVATNAANPAPANLTLLVQSAPNFPIAQGDIVIPDDTPLYPAVVLDPGTDYAIRRFVHPFSASEQGDTLHTSGHSLMLRRPTDVTTDHLQLFDETYAPTDEFSFSPAIGNTTPAIRSNQTTQKFWILYFGDPTLYNFSMTAEGVTSTVENMGDTYNRSSSVASSPDETILYFVDDDSAIHRWDLINHVALSDLVATTSGYGIVDMLVLSDGTILAGLFKSSPKDFKVNHYATDGTILHTKDFGSDIRGVTPRMAYSIDNLTSYWIYIPGADGGANDGKSFVRQVQISDGSLLTDRVYAMYEVGKYRAAATATPTAPFGPSNSCPFWIVGTSSTPTETFPIRRQRRFLLPSSDSNFKMNIPDIEILIRTGIGLKPDSWTPDTATPLGADPQVMFRMSKDGGETWTNERWISAGQRGQRERRVRLVRATGDYRNGVLEVSVDAPVDWQFISALGTPREGTS